MNLLDLSHTSHTRARSGIQRVSRALYRELTKENKVIAVTWDPYAKAWRELNTVEIENLEAEAPASTRGARWPWSRKMYSRFQGWRGTVPALPSATGLIVPELFSPAVAGALPRLKTGKPRIAIFHDAIALKLPELSPLGTVACFPSYMQELLQFDGIAAVSEESRQSLLDYWKWLGVSQQPPVQTIPLGLDHFERDNDAPAENHPPVVLCVGSIEGRKNHLALLEAAELLWADGHNFNLRLIGMANKQTGHLALQKIHSLQQSGHPLKYDGAVDETTLASAYATCSFTVYPSIMEGFGLPVLESLARGKPCICSAHGALGESARPGGAVALDEVSIPAIQAAIARLLRNPAEISQLSTKARSRTYRSWSQYTSDLLAWMDSLP